ncbi:MAG: diguanylate cyclase [Deltaproteobacteria bacterium]|nr:diguanylate cyclase [Deltaproteobacteria bacterium]
MSRRPSVETKIILGVALFLAISLFVLAELLLYPGFHLAERFGRIGFILLFFFSFSLFTVVALFLLTYWFVTRPLGTLMSIMQTAEEKDFLVRAPVLSEDLIGRLSRVFNRLMERMTTLDVIKLETERKLIQVQEELKYQEVLEEKNRRLTLLYDIARAISATLEFEELIHVLTDVIARRLGFKEFAILLWNPKKEVLIVRTTFGFKEEVKLQDMTFKLGEGVSGMAALTKEIIYIRDTKKDPRYLHYKGQKKEDGSFVSIPLLFKNNLVGVMNFSRPGVNQFSDEEREMLQAVASQIAVALINVDLYARTKDLSIKDELTDLYNRRYLQQILPMEIKRAKRFSRPVSILMVDIDSFKKYNDAYGHLEGDVVLREFARLLRENLREVDVIIRFGGEEFLVLLPNTNREQALTVSDKLLGWVRQHPFPNRQTQPTGHFTVSTGLSCYPEDAQSADDLVDHADVALYQAKGQGRDRVVAYTEFTKGESPKGDSPNGVSPKSSVSA